MATQNHTNTIPAASFGVEVDNAGRVSITAMGEIDARIAEQVRSLKKWHSPAKPRHEFSSHSPTAFVESIDPNQTLCN